MAADTLTIRPAGDDNDVVAIHGFLCLVAGPGLPGKIAPKESIEEIWRVVHHECALVATEQRDDGKEYLVGTLGLIKVPYWWNPQITFLVNRWFFVLPNSGAGKPLRAEAETIAKDLGMECQIWDEARGRLLILNKSPLRSVVNPFTDRPPVEPTHPPHVTQQ